MKQKYLLVVRADQSVRIAKRPRLMADEIAIPVVLDFPAGWGRVLTGESIEIKVPDFTPEVIREIGDQR